MATVQLQMLFSATEEKQQKSRILKASIKDAIENSKGYKEAREEYDKSKEKMKQIEYIIKQDFTADLDQIDNIKAELDMDKENMSAIALEKFKTGDSLIVKGKNGFDYEVNFVVKFKKLEQAPDQPKTIGLGLDD